MSFALDIALGWYLEKGLAIFPCKEKKPMIETGVKAASKDPDQVRNWWTTWPKAQFGVPTGQINSLLVVDIDGPNGQAWLAKQNWPTTFTVETSPGHLQLWFKQPHGLVTKCSAGQIAEEVDIRGDGGYVIGPFSFHHETKHAYTPQSFIVPSEAPASLLMLATANGDAPFSPPVDGDVIPKGQRHRTMVSFAGSMRPHRYRDSFAVDMLARGANPYDVAKLMGDTVATVEEHYAPFVKELRDRARQIMEKGEGLEKTRCTNFAQSRSLKEQIH